MDSRIVVTSGDAKGTVVKLSGPELSVGRDSSNGLRLPDRAVSRKHFSISVSDAGFVLVDLGSHNGTFVNGVPVRRKLLQHGDTIRAGACELVLLVTEDENLVGNLVQVQDQSPPGLLETVTVPILPIPEPMPAQEIGRMARDLNALFKIANTINSIRDLQLLQRHILQLICEVAPADSAAIVMISLTEQEPTSSCTWNRTTRKEAELTLPRELMQRALWERSLVLSRSSSGSSPAETTLCVPLAAMEKTLGVLYLVTAAATGFGHDHVNFVSSVAGIAAVALENVLALEELRNENNRLQRELDMGGIVIGEGGRMRQVQEFVARVAHADSTILLRGESGTGKELVAHAIHRSGLRADKPFIAINCAAIPETLLESELFGHEKGAFTGAIATKKGKLEVAEDGTVFLDEIGELSPALQAKLLRVLQQREFERVGGTRPMNFQARVIAATNKDLEQAIKSAQFRQDLYYRLNVVSLRLPPLRERREDIPLLALYFASKYAQRCKRPLKGISSQARALLMAYDWPGNVRELENAIEHAMVLGESDEILAEDLPAALLEVQHPEEPSSRYHDRVNEVKKQLIIDAVAQAHGNYTDAAKLLGLHPNYLHRLIRNFGIKGQVAGE